MAEEASSFLELARGDLRAAALLEGAEPRQATFHLQQAAEKMLKAVLSVEGLPFPKIHSIGALASRLPHDHPWRRRLAALDRLTVAATTMRYPAAAGGLPPAPEAAEVAADRREVTALLDALEPWVRARLDAS